MHRVLKHIRVNGALLLAGALVSGAHAQRGTTPDTGIRDATPRVHALVGLTVHVAPGVVLDDATIVVRDGRIEAVGAGLAPPDDARVWLLPGRVAFAGFIDAYSTLGLPDWLLPRRPASGADGPPPPPEPPVSSTGFWSPFVLPEVEVSSLLELDADALESFRNVGFAAALSAPRRGVLRGQSALISVAGNGDAGKSVVAVGVAQHASFEVNTTPRGDYPTALMGAIALLRQALYDAQWYRDTRAFETANRDAERAAQNSALDALVDVIGREQPLFVETEDELDYARVAAVADEFGIGVVLIGNGYEYRKRDWLAESGMPVVIPLAFPEVPAIDSPDRALEVSLEALQHWELAPSNAAYLAGAGIEFAFTTDGMADVGEDFWKNVRLAVERGLDADAALAALTTTPAALAGVADRLGTVEAGKIANLVIADADPFIEEGAELELMFVDGSAFELPGYRDFDPEGRWRFSWPGGTGDWEIREAGPRLTLQIGDEEFRARIEGEQLLLFPAASALGRGTGTAQLAGRLRDGSVDGNGVWPDGSTFAWQAVRIGPSTDGDGAGEAGASPDDSASDEAAAGEAAAAGAPDGAPDDDVPPLTDRPYPAGAYGRMGLPAAPEAVLVRGATIWTSGPAGRLDNADLLIRDGRIAAVGSGLEAPRGAIVIDGGGKHVTPGLIDAHSHTAISRGINEVGSAITLEVRVADVLDPTDIGIYRELAGGLTVANVMHGSANPMGGQTQTIKLRWGGAAEDLLFDGAVPGVKFALGENVKQSNWGDRFTTRYPQTRMGVEQIIRDTFNAALAYRAERAGARRGPPVRRNIRLDAALEILDRERVVHVHSYRQDEILAFVRLAQDYDLDVAAFQHVLEGYKVAPEIASIGAGGSTFSDWWAYKVEVQDAIPFNGALMHAAGVVTSFNSDDDELATRLNTEAAKAVKYGGLGETDALAFVTINPAIQLGIDARVGSLERGKDADFVIWNGNPLSAFTRAEQTWIDGRLYFDLAADAGMREQVDAERARLVQKALAAARSPGAGGGEGSSDSTGRAAAARHSDIYDDAAELSHARQGDLTRGSVDE